MKIALRLVVLLIVVSGAIAYRAFRQLRLDRDLYTAVQGSDLKAIRELLARGASPRTRPRSMPLLTIAINRHDNEVALALIRAGADGVPDRFVNTAVLANNDYILRKLIRRGAVLNRPGLYNHRFTPLMIAAERGSADMVRLLLDNGANPNLRCRDRSQFAGETALSRAAIVRRPDIVKMLLDRGADPNVRFGGERGLTPLTNAIVATDVESVRILLARGADPDLRVDGRYAAYSFAAMVPNSAAAEPSPGARQRGWRPTDAKKLRQIMALIKAAGAKDLRVPDKDGNLPGEHPDGPPAR